MNFTKSDITILGKLNDAGLSNEMKSATIKGIAKISSLSEMKVRQSVALLQKEKLLNVGFKQKNANTYFITNEGIEFLRKLGLSK